MNVNTGFLHAFTFGAIGNALLYADVQTISPKILRVYQSKSGACSPTHSTFAVLFLGHSPDPHPLMGGDYLEISPGFKDLGCV